MGIESAQFLLARGADLVVLAVQCQDFEITGATLVAGAQAAIVVTVPPQATGELAVAPGRIPLFAAARLSGPSHLTFQVTAGTQVPMTVAGILGALHDAAAIPVLTPAGDPAATIELPWRLLLSPRPVSSGDALTADFAPLPVAGPTGATGLWRLRLTAPSGLALLPLPPFEPDDPGFVPPLDADARSQIGVCSVSPGPPPTAASVELTALGGSLTAKGTWPEFAWEQRTVVGRDMSVHTVEKGVLYPLGHRAVLIETTERTLYPPGSGRADAILLTARTLVVTERVIRPADHSARAAREFPFDAVEILQGSFPVGPPADVRRHTFVPKQLDALVASLDAATQASAAQDQAVVQLRQSQDAAIEQSFDDEAVQIELGIAPISQQITDLEAAEQAFEAWVATHPPTVSPPATPVVVSPDDGSGRIPVSRGTGDGDDGPGPPQPDLSPLPGLEAQVQALTTQLLAIPAQKQQALDAIATDDGLAALGGDFAVAVAQARQLQASAAALAQHVAAVQNQQALTPPVYETPTGLDGNPLAVPVRCGDLTFSLPVVFIYDLPVPDSDDFPAFDALSDAQVRGELSTSWGSKAVVPLPGVPLDLVRSSAPNALDVHEVHQLSVVAGPLYPVAGAPLEQIRPALDSLLIDLPAVRTLLPGAASQVPVLFHPDYLDRGDVADVALALKDALPVDFTAAADRAGALIAPAFQADVLSRTQGLVAAATLAGMPSLSTVFAGATLLGIDLAKVIDGVPAPLGVVPILDGVRPVGARMAWDLKLKDHGPLRVHPDTTLTMRVERSPARTDTTCQAVDFDFVLPPTGTQLIRLHFAALEFTQKLGHPPHLTVTGPTIALGGDLNLLKTLQDAVDLGSAAPAIHQTPTGVSARYALAVPEVAAGVFTLRNIAFSAGVDVPFDGQPVVASLAFASRDDPFSLSVMAFGGGGYLCFQIAQEGIRQLEASLDFGASVAISVGLASAEVHALGGVRLELQEGGDVTVTGFLRIGGSVDVLGLVSVSVELRVDLTYQEVRDPATGALKGESLSGRATLVIEVDVTFWSGSIELDSGEYTFAGPDPGGGAPSVSTSSSPPTLPDWQDYRNAFAPEPT